MPGPLKVTISVNLGRLLVGVLAISEPVLFWELLRSLLKVLLGWILGPVTC